jgi:hypothetical protein
MLMTKHSEIFCHTSITSCPSLAGCTHYSSTTQIGDQEYLNPSDGGVEDMALEVEKALAKEQVCKTS